MRRRIDVPVGRPHRDAKRVSDLRRPERLVVAHEARQDRQPRRVGGRPGVGTTVVLRQIEERAGSRQPLRAVVEDVEELVQVPVVAIHDQDVTVARAAPVDVAGLAALHPVRLCDGLVGNRIERKALVRGVVDAVALAEILELHGLLRRGAADDQVREPVNPHAAGRRVSAEVGVQLPRRPDEVDVGRRRRRRSERARCPGSTSSRPGRAAADRAAARPRRTARTPGPARADASRHVDSELRPARRLTHAESVRKARASRDLGRLLSKPRSVCPSPRGAPIPIGFRNRQNWNDCHGTLRSGRCVVLSGHDADMTLEFIKVISSAARVLRKRHPEQRQYCS